jgi:uracil-DNA glycosylase family 4
VPRAHLCKDAAPARDHRLAQLRIEARGCVRCPLSSSRTQVVFGDGDPNADLMLVGEAPGAEEDSQGLPFRGAAGANLEMFLAEIGFGRSDVYIANVAMCRPPGNRPVRRAEMLACASYLDDQVRLVDPRVVIALGAAPTKRFLGVEATVAGSRGRSHRIGRAVLVSTYHPSPLSLNRAPERHGLIQADLRLAKGLLSADRLPDS